MSPRGLGDVGNRMLLPVGEPRDEVEDALELSGRGAHRALTRTPRVYAR